MENTLPNLTEIDTRYYLNNSLKKVRTFKDKYIIIFIIFNNIWWSIVL